MRAASPGSSISFRDEGLSIGDQRRLVDEADIVFGNIPAEWVLTQWTLTMASIGDQGLWEPVGATRICQARHEG